MIEIVGDFDVGNEAFDGVQKQVAIECVADLLIAFPAADVKFHNELGSPKTCPGTSIDKAALVAEIDARVREKQAEPRAAARARAASPFAVPTDAGSLYRATVGELGPIDAESAAVPEHDAVLRWNEPRAHVHEPSRAPLLQETSDFERGGEDWSELRPHVVNLSKGRLSTGGEFEMDAGSIDAILDGLRGYALTTAEPRLVLFAHGGLVKERVALHYAKATRAWWMNHRVYPIYFVWESGFLETILQSIFGARGIDDLWDKGLEVAARPIGLPLWTAMKESARLSSSPDTGDGWPGGAFQFVQALQPVLTELDAAQRRPDVHAIGHSAGAIFHSHLLPLMDSLGIAIESLSLLAPAIRVDRFDASLKPLRDQDKVRSLHLFTMNEEAELSDTVGPYLKSLLYLISRALEPRQPTPILGLQASIRDDDELEAWLDSHAEVQYSRLPDEEPNPLTKANKHGGFDNDTATMAAVLRRIRRLDDATGVGDDFPERESSRELVAMLERSASRAVPAPAQTPSAESAAAQPAPAQPTAGRRIALCIGIDQYSIRPLAGCVNDARQWASLLGRQRFEVSLLLDRQATQSGIADALRAMVTSARAGDILVVQYSGHGTQVEDANADEDDGYDEAFVPIDFDRGNLLLDDDIAEIASGLAPGALLTLFMDCCHSGTISRFQPIAPVAIDRDERVRYLQLPREVERAHLDRRRGERRAAAPSESLPGVVHFAACRDDEFAFETQGQGDFTRAAMKHLAAAIDGRSTNEAFLAQMRGELAARGRQHPGLMRLPANLRDRPLLGGRETLRSDVSGPTRPSDSDLVATAEALVTALRLRLAAN